VATFLVGRGELLKGSTGSVIVTRPRPFAIRNYAHALPLEDEAIADDLDEMLQAWRRDSRGAVLCRASSLEPFPDRRSVVLAGRSEATEEVWRRASARAPEVMPLCAVRWSQP
jgi:hypothetical protein